MIIWHAELRPNTTKSKYRYRQEQGMARINSDALHSKITYLKKKIENEEINADRPARTGFETAYPVLLPTN